VELTVKYVEATWVRALKVWCSILWKTWLFIFPYLLVFIFITEVVFPEEIITAVFPLVSALIIAFVCVWVLKRILNRKKAYSDFKITLNEKEERAPWEDLGSKQESVTE
jgi:hypothetical protein